MLGNLTTHSMTVPRRSSFGRVVSQGRADESEEMEEGEAEED